MYNHTWLHLLPLTVHDTDRTISGVQSQTSTGCEQLRGHLIKRTMQVHLLGSLGMWVAHHPMYLPRWLGVPWATMVK